MDVNMHVLDAVEQRFVESFGTPEKPMTISEFMEFWRVLTESERTEIIMDYGPVWFT